MTSQALYPLLETIASPAELRRLPVSRLESLARQLRQFLVQSIANCGGHFAAGLGAVELTIALHYVFDTPEDRLVWDIGHQCYPHKILTQRRARLGTIRRKGGLAAFLRRSESPYDVFGAGHCSTSISAALGMAVAAAKAHSGRKVVAIIGDGAMTAGLAYEALNNASNLGLDLLVILSDNKMSISPNVGALTNYLVRLQSVRTYAAPGKNGRKVFKRFPVGWGFAKDDPPQEDKPDRGAFFEALGLRYFGPVDGHHLPTLLETLRSLKSQTGPRLLHLVTRKGKGYEPAENDPVKYHGVSKFDPGMGIQSSAPAATPTYTQVFGDWLCDMAILDERLMAITPAMREGSGLVRFAKQFPDRYFDVAIAEQHSVTFAAGLACDGLKPVVAIYSTFLQRAYDQLIHDVVIQELPVLFAIDRAGLVGPDGPTHAGSFDFTYWRCLPKVVVMAPADENECRQMLYTGFLLDQPVSVRYPRGKGPGVPLEKAMRPLPVGKAELRRRGSRIALLAFGTMVTPAMAVGETLDTTVVNMRFVKPLDEEMVLSLAESHDYLVTLEENVIPGGAGAAVFECLSAHTVDTPLFNIGLPDRFVEQGTREEMLADAELDASGILRSVKRFLAAHAKRDTHPARASHFRRLRPRVSRLHTI